MKTEYLLEREVELILAALMPGNALALRTALHTGLRIGDVLQLRPEQLAPRFWVTEQKTGKKRQVGLPAALLADLKESAGEHWVFPGRDPTKHRTRQAVWKDMRRAAWAFRLPINVGPHSARKVYAVDLMRKYGDIERVRRALNHNSETVTLLYAMADMQRAAKHAPKKGVDKPQLPVYHVLQMAAERGKQKPNETKPLFCGPGRPVCVHWLTTASDFFGSR